MGMTGPPPPAAGTPGPPPGPTGSPGPTGPEPAPVPPWNIGRLRVPDARASAASQVVVYLVAAFAFGIAGWASGGYEHALAAMAALGLGAVLGATTEADRAFRQASGVVLGLLTTVALTVASVIGAGVLRLDVGDADLATQLLLGAGLLVAGLDWRRVPRLKVVPALSGVLVVVVVATASGPVLALGVAWLALAVAALWSLEVDQRRAYDRPRSLGPTGVAPDDGARDLLASLALALLLGVILASFAAVPSCRPSLGHWNLPWQPGGGTGEGPSGPDLLSFSTNWEAFGFARSQGEQFVEIDGELHRLVEGESGRPELENLVTGERLSLALEGDDLVARDRAGTERARFRHVDRAAADQGGGTDWRRIALLALLALAVAVAVGLLWRWYRRRRPPPADARSWAEERVRDLDRFGRSHRRPRAPGATIHQHTALLVGSVAPDDRLHRVGAVVSDALFGRDEPSLEERLWTEQVIQEITTTHPPARWWRRSRGRGPSGASERPTP